MSRGRNFLSPILLSPIQVVSLTLLDSLTINIKIQQAQDTNPKVCQRNFPKWVNIVFFNVMSFKHFRALISHS